MTPSVEERRAVEEAEEDHRRHAAMAAHEKRGKELAAELQAANAAVQEANRRLAAARQTTVGLDVELGKLPSRAHETLRLLAEQAGERFYSTAVHAPLLANLAAGIPPALPPALAGLHLLADATFVERLHEVIDRRAADPAQQELTTRDEATIRAELEETRLRAAEAKRAVASADEKVAEVAPRVRAHAYS